MIPSRLLAASLAALSLCSCGILTGPAHSRFGAASGAALSNVGGADATGVYGSGRFEVAQAVSEDNDRIEMGARLLIGGRGYDPDDLTSATGTDVENSAVDVGLDAVLRLYAEDADAKVRPYFEAFGGLAMQQLDLELSTPAARATLDDFAFGASVGGAIGLEFPFGEESTFAFGSEARFTSFEFSNFGDIGAGDLQTDGIDIGLFFMFGTHF